MSRSSPRGRDPVTRLSEEGAFILTDRPLSEGLPVFLELALGTASNAAVGYIDAVVTSASANGMAGFDVRFLDLDAAVRVWIQHHVTVEPAPSAEPSSMSAEPAPIDDGSDFDLDFDLDEPDLDEPAAPAAVEPAASADPPPPPPNTDLFSGEGDAFSPFEEEPLDPLDLAPSDPESVEDPFAAFAAVSAPAEAPFESPPPTPADPPVVVGEPSGEGIPEALVEPEFEPEVDVDFDPFALDSPEEFSEESLNPFAEESQPPSPEPLADAFGEPSVPHEKPPELVAAAPVVDDEAATEGFGFFDEPSAAPANHNPFGEAPKTPEPVVEEPALDPFGRSEVVDAVPTPPPGFFADESSFDEQPVEAADPFADDAPSADDLEPFDEPSAAPQLTSQTIDDAFDEPSVGPQSGFEADTRQTQILGTPAQAAPVAESATTQILPMPGAAADEVEQQPNAFAPFVSPGAGTIRPDLGQTETFPTPQPSPVPTPQPFPTPQPAPPIEETQSFSLARGPAQPTPPSPSAAEPVEETRGFRLDRKTPPPLPRPAAPAADETQAFKVSQFAQAAQQDAVSGGFAQAGSITETQQFAVSSVEKALAVDEAAKNRSTLPLGLSLADLQGDTQPIPQPRTPPLGSPTQEDPRTSTLQFGAVSLDPVQDTQPIALSELNELNELDEPNELPLDELDIELAADEFDAPVITGTPLELSEVMSLEDLDAPPLDAIELPLAKLQGGSEMVSLDSSAFPDFGAELDPFSEPSAIPGEPWRVQEPGALRGRSEPEDAVELDLESLDEAWVVAGTSDDKE